MTAWPSLAGSYVASIPSQAQVSASTTSTAEVIADGCPHFFAAQSPLHLFIAGGTDLHLFTAQSPAHFFKVAPCTTH